jgi:hypothetical protein
MLSFKIICLNSKNRCCIYMMEVEFLKLLRVYLQFKIDCIPYQCLSSILNVWKLYAENCGNLTQAILNNFISKKNALMNVRNV